MTHLKQYVILGTLFVTIFGTLSHFIYEWSGSNFVLGFFFPINESIWEHMKLVFFPMLLFSFYMNRKIVKFYPNVTAALSFGILLGTFLIPAVFYLYVAVLGHHTLPLDIGVFVLAVIISFAVVYKLTLSHTLQKYNFPLQICVLILALMFIVFTYFPPKFEIFVDPTAQR